MPKGHHQRTIDKITILVRMELAAPHLTPSEICKVVGIRDLSRLSILKKSPYYLILKNQQMTGIITDLNGKIKSRYDTTKDTLDYAVPIAMQGLLNQALNSKDERVRNKAYNDILDRDGRFAKVKRIGLPTQDQGGVTNPKDNEEAAELIQALNGAKAFNNQNKVTIDSAPVSEKTQ
jgi:hypothetical protein